MTNHLFGDVFTNELEATYRTGMIAGRHMTIKEGIMELKTFGERLFWARRNHAKCTQTELRDKMEKLYSVKIGANYISEIEKETAKKRPSFEVVSAMAKALKISLDWLAGVTTVFEVSQAEDEPPHFFSPEADEVAQLVDGMSHEQREMIVNIARSLNSPLTEQRRMRASIKAMLESVERNLGVEARKEFERILREKGNTWNEDTQT